MAGVNREGEDLFNAICGDLGLGNSQRSSIFLNYDLEVNKYFSTPAYFRHLHHGNSGDHSGKHHHDGKHRIQDFFRRGFLGNMFTWSHTARYPSVEGPESDDQEVFPTYANIPYGTSYRQQKKLYDKEIGHLRQQKNSVSVQEVAVVKDKGKGKKDVRKKGKDIPHMSAEDLDSKLADAMVEMDELKVELDACCKRLDAKYQAVAILKKQAEMAKTELQSTEEKFHENNRRLEKEVSKLQFELEWRESSFMDSQQTWAERFDRVCQENALLMSKLEARSEELRRMTAHKSAIARERDELLALLDVTERLKYEQGKSLIAEEEYGSFSSSELAVLGACKCRGSNPEPCGCAHAAANMRKEVAKLREEIQLGQQRRQEAYLTVDAYRIAFEEQIARARVLSQRLATLSTISSRAMKAKAAMQYLIQVLKEENLEVRPLKEIQCPEVDRIKAMPPMSIQQLVQVLTDLVHEKKEALAHQKLAAQVLANKLNMFETIQRQLGVNSQLFKYDYNEVDNVKPQTNSDNVRKQRLNSMKEEVEKSRQKLDEEISRRLADEDIDGDVSEEVASTRSGQTEYFEAQENQLSDYNYVDDDDDDEEATDLDNNQEDLDSTVDNEINNTHEENDHEEITEETVSDNGPTMENHTGATPNKHNGNHVDNSSEQRETN